MVHILIGGNRSYLWPHADLADILTHALSMCREQHHQLLRWRCQRVMTPRA